MNYTNIYNQLMESAKGRHLTDYTEKHHIIPKCLGGTNDVDNLIDLTPEEHYLAHQLLVKMYPNHAGLAYAAELMCYGADGRRNNNKSFGWIKRIISKHKKAKTLTEEQKENLRRKATGKKHTPETKAAISKSCTGARKNYKHSAETLEKLRLSHKLKPRTHSTNTKSKISNSMVGRIKEEIVCPHCGKSGGKPAMTRWHFDNCKKLN